MAGAFQSLYPNQQQSPWQSQQPQYNPTGMFQSLYQNDKMTPAYAPPELSGGMFQALMPPIRPPANDPGKAVEGMQQRIEASGQKTPLYVKPLSALMWGLKQMDRPRNMVANVVDKYLDYGDKEQGAGDYLKAMWDGFSLKKEVSARDILEKQGVTNKAALFVGGLAGDIAMNPLTFMSTAKLGGFAMKKMGPGADKLAASLGYKGTAFTDDLLGLVGKKSTDYISEKDFGTVLGKLIDEQDTAINLAKGAVKQRAGSAGYYLPGFTDFLRKNPDQWDTLVDVLKHSSPNPHLTTASMRALSKATLGAADPALFDIIDGLSQDQLSLFINMTGMFGTEVPVAKILTSATRIGKDTGKFVTKLSDLTAKETLAKQTLAKTLEGIEYASGIQQTYNKMTKTISLSFMGKPLATFEKAQGAVSNAITQAYSKNKTVREVMDIMGPMFNGRYISPMSYGDDKVAFGVKLTETAKREATAVPRSAVEWTNRIIADPKMKSNLNVRKAATSYIERNMDAAATAAWDDWLKILSPEEVTLTQQLAKQAEDAMKFMARMEGIPETELLESYVTHLLKVDPAFREFYSRMPASKLAAASGHASLNERLLKGSIADIMAKGYKFETTDIMDIMSIRYARGQLSMVNKDYIEALRKYPGLLISNKKEAISLGYQAIPRELIPELAGHYTSPDMIRQMQRLNDLFLYDTSSQQALRYFSQITNKIKSLQTTANPAFQLRNWFSEHMHTYMDSADPFKSLSKARKIKVLEDPVLKNATQSSTWANNIFRAADNTEMLIAGATRTKASLLEELKQYGVQFLDEGKNTPTGFTYIIDLLESGTPMEQAAKMAKESLVEIGGNLYSRNDFFVHVFNRSGLHFAGVHQGDYVRKMGDMLDEQIRMSGVPVPSRTDNPVSNIAASYMTKMRDFGDETETMARLIHMIDKMDQGIPWEEAATLVSYHHVDYRDITKFEANVMRRFIPYYAYMRRNIPNQLRLVMEKPWYPVALAALQENAMANVGNPDISRHLEEKLAIPLWKNDDGTIQFLNWNLPIGNLGNMYVGKGALAENFKSGVGMLNPLVKLPFEMATNQNIGLGTKIQSYEGQKMELFPSMQNSPKVSPTLIYGLKQLGAADVARQTAGMMTPYEKDPDGYGMTKQVPIFSSLFPRRTEQQMGASHDYSYKDQLSDFMRASRDQGHVYPEMSDLTKVMQSGGFFSTKFPPLQGEGPFERLYPKKLGR